MNNTVYQPSLVKRSWYLLKLTYTLAPLLIGIDKLYTWWLVDWAKYVSPYLVQLSPAHITTIVLITGVIEIVAGIIVWFYPRFGGYLVAAWMLLVIIDLITIHAFYDIIARDVVITVGALVLAWLTEAQQE